MADLAISIVQNLITVINSPFIKEICDVWNYKSHLEHLEKTVGTVKEVLLDADSKRELTHEARGYIADLKDAVYDADDLFDEIITLAESEQLHRRPLSKGGKLFEKVRCFFTSKNKASQAYRMSREVKKIRRQLDDIVSDHQKFGFSVDYKPICRRRVETCSHVDAKDIIGREDDEKAVIDMLLRPNDVHESLRFVTIVGVGGLGKTALAQLVYNNEKVRAEFPERFWVCVSDQDGQQFDVKLILCKILELISGTRPDDTSSMQLVNNQFQQKLGGKKYFLVLDDVWSENRMELRELHKFLIVGQEGSRILVTTRSGKTAKIIGENQIHELQGLSPKDSWILFDSVAFDKGEQEQVNRLELVEIGKKIVEKCSNTPLAIKVVGSLLYGQPIDTWQTFEHSGLAGIENGNNEIMSILKLSYYNLTPSLKSCFSYCALFPKDVTMKRNELIGFWMAQGYIEPFHRGQSIEDAAEEHFLILVQRCFFQDVKNDKYGEIKSVKMHDLMHDVALEVGREEIGVVSSNTTELLENKVRHVYFAGSFSQSYPLKSKIRSFILTPSRLLGDMKDASLDSWMRVRVLVLNNANIKRLPDSIGKLLHLRYLDLSCNYYDLKALPSCITTLHNLQTLDLRDCWSLRELPIKINKLVKLRYLDLRGCDQLISIPLGIDKLTNLRYLDLRGCDQLISIPLGIDKLTNLRYLDLSRCDKLINMPCMDKLTNLRHFDLRKCSLLRSMPSGMGKMSNLRVLPFFVVGMKKRVSSHGEQQCMGELKDLKPLTNIEGGIEIKIGKYYLNDDGEGGYLKGMNHLTQVEIRFYDGYDYDDDDDDDDDDGGGCIEWEGVIEKLEPPSNLKKFSLRGYEGTTIPRWGRAHDNWSLSLPHLVEIELLDCKKLEQIPSLSRLRNLKSLSLMHLYKLEYMENKSSSNGNDLVDLTTFFPSLETLFIYAFVSFKGWWREDELVKVEDEDDDDLILKSSFTFPRLSKLNIIQCPNLTSFPSFPSLKNIAISDVDFLKSIDSQCLITSLDINHNEKVESVSEFGDVFRKYTSSLRSLSISNCSKLRRIGRGGLEHLTALEELTFFSNDQMSFSEDEVDDEDMPWRSLPLSLHSLKFGRLKNMKSLPKGMQYLTSLRSLTIISCDNISGLPEWISCLSSLQSLSIDGCRAMKSLPESMRNLTSLQELKINWCRDELRESCKKPNGKDWLKIQHIPNIEMH